MLARARTAWVSFMLYLRFAYHLRAGYVYNAVARQLVTINTWLIARTNAHGAACAAVNREIQQQTVTARYRVAQLEQEILRLKSEAGELPRE